MSDSNTYNNNSNNSNNSNNKTSNEAKDTEPIATTQTLLMLKKRGFTIGEKINYGSFSKVYKAKFNGKEIAVKVINLDQTSLDYRHKFLPRELNALSKLRHPNIVCIYEIFDIGKKIFIFMDLADGGDLLEYLKQFGAIPEVKAKIWFKQIADALQYIHNYGIVHRDLKIENILLDKNGFVKLTDFGFSRPIFEPRTGKRVLSHTYCGSISYVAPEVLSNTPYKPMLADIWSLGVVLFTMLNNIFPFDDSDLTKMMQAQLAKKFSYASTIEKQLSFNVKNLISSMLEPDLNKRLTINKVLAHSWLKDVENKTPKF